MQCLGDISTVNAGLKEQADTQSLCEWSKEKEVLFKKSQSSMFYDFLVLFFMSEEVIVNQTFTWKKWLSHKMLYSSCEEHERNISVPTCTLVSRHAGREQAHMRWFGSFTAPYTIITCNYFKWLSNSSYSSSCCTSLETTVMVNSVSF